jgi:hypothetical protein
MMQHTIADELQQSFIWLSGFPEHAKEWVGFRKQFILPDDYSEVKLHLFADSRYWLWINGRYVLRGPARFDPKGPEYDTIDITKSVQHGENTIAVLVHHYLGHDSLRMVRHVPGLSVCCAIASGDAVRRFFTDETWVGNGSLGYMPADSSWSSIPDNIDARLGASDWMRKDFHDSGWLHGSKIDGGQWLSLTPRSIPLLRESSLNVSLRDCDSGLPHLLNESDELVIDPGQTVQAFVILDFDADDGTQIELRCGGWVNRYTARAGSQCYMTTDTFGMRYACLRVVCGQVRLQRIQMVNRLYPYELVGTFHSNDEFLNRIWRKSVHTAHLLSEDAHVDCADRERAEWIADCVVASSPITRSISNGVSSVSDRESGHVSDSRLLRRMLRNAALSQQSDGRTKAHTCSDRWDIHAYIEDFACLWVQGLRQYLEQTGDVSFADELWSCLRKQIDWFLKQRTANGLFAGREFVIFDNPHRYKTGEGATLNAFIYRALLDAAAIAETLGYEAESENWKRQAQALFDAFNQLLWRESDGVYSAAIFDGVAIESTAHAALFALNRGIVPTERRSSVVQWLIAGDQADIWMPYTYSFLIEELYKLNAPNMDAEILDRIRRRWTQLENLDVDTLGEGIDGGSPMHAFGTLPAYWLSAYVLGVQLDGPARQRRLHIQPRLGDLTDASGVVVTELGLVKVIWNRDRNGFNWTVDLPENVTATVLLPWNKAGRFIVDESLIEPTELSIMIAPRNTDNPTSFAAFELSEGTHAGYITNG